MHEIDIGNRDIFETAVRFRAEFETSCRSVFVGREFLRRSESSVENCSEIKTGNLRIGDRDVFRRAVETERVTAFQNNRVVVRRIDR